MFKTWTLNTDPEIYNETKTEQYFIFNGSKYYIWKVNFVEHATKKPIIAEFGPSAPEFANGTVNAEFTEKGKAKLPFLYAVKEV